MTNNLARKDDASKPDLTLIPYSALAEEAYGMMLGERKYGRDNYKLGGMDASRLAAAALRHIYLWVAGEDNDQESGHSHLGHARCCLAMIIETKRLGTLRDNRFGRKAAESLTTEIGVDQSISTTGLKYYQPVMDLELIQVTTTQSSDTTDGPIVSAAKKAGVF